MTGFSQQTEGDRVPSTDPRARGFSPHCWEHRPLLTAHARLHPPHLCYVFLKLWGQRGRRKAGLGPGSAGAAQHPKLGSPLLPRAASPCQGGT